MTSTTPGLVGSTTVTAPDAQNATAFQVVISDPDVAAPTRFDNINFDGDETITVRHDANAAPYNETFTPDTLQLDGTNPQTATFYYVGPSGANGRKLLQLSYRKSIGNDNTAALVIPLLEESRKTPATSTPTLKYPEHVRLAYYRRDVTIKAMQLLGTRTTTTELPTSGVRTMVGESFGIRTFTFGTDKPFDQAYIGDSVLSVDFGARKVTGQINITQFVGLTPVRPALVVTVNGTIGSDGTLSGTVSVTGTDGITEAGFLTGSLYGSSADEIGIVISTSGTSGSIIGGLVAGQEQ